MDEVARRNLSRYNVRSRNESRSEEMMYQVTYIREPWFEAYETDCPEDGNLGTFTWEEIQDSVTNGAHGSGWVPGKYHVSADLSGDDDDPDGDREADFYIVIGEAPGIKEAANFLRQIPSDELCNLLEHTFMGRSGTKFAELIENKFLKS